jgi:ribosomal protein S18 acetylase RimI-like enzyme
VPEGLTVRAAAAADARVVADLVRSAYRGEESRQGWTTEADLMDGQRTDPDQVRRLIASPDATLLIGELHGEPVTCCSLERRPDGSAYFGMFAVRPGLQGRGIGRAMLAEAERRATQEWRSGAMRMWVLEPRSELIAWYERLGYRRTGQTMPWRYDDPTWDRPKRAGLLFVELSKALEQPSAVHQGGVTGSPDG